MANLFDSKPILYENSRPLYPSSHLEKTLKKLSCRNKYLDVATGTGRLLLQFAGRFSLAKGIDNNPKMIKTCQEKLKHFSHPNLKVQLLDVRSLHKDEKYDLITVGQALHWFSVRESLEKMHNSLEKGGVLAVYGYIAKSFAAGNGKRTKHYDDLYRKLIHNRLGPYFPYDLNEILSHYSHQRYPFDEFFSIQRQVEEVANSMNKQTFLNYLRTVSGYRVYVEKNNDDPLQEIEKQLEEEVSMIHDFFVIWCKRKCDL